MKDYSEYLLTCRELLAAVSESAMNRRYVAATWHALHLAREALRLSAALRMQRVRQQTIDARQS